MIPLSVLDLVPVREGGTLAQALDEAAKLAATAEQAGYKRFWVAEHHGMPGIASALLRRERGGRRHERRERSGTVTAHGAHRATGGPSG